jgi:hypothetical protein
MRLTAGVSCGGWEGGLALETEKPKAKKTLQKRAAYPPSASKMGEDTADRPSAGPSETVVQPGSPCPVTWQPEQLRGLEDRLLARA